MQKGFNFLKPQVEPPSQWTALYDWIVGTARIILLTVEIIVIIALVVRIFVDTYSKRLDDDIETYENIMSNRGQEEAKYRTLQTKALAYKTDWEKTDVLLNIMKEVDKYLPVNGSEISVQVNLKSIIISGKASKTDVDRMELGIKNSDLFINPKLTSLETGNAEEAKFSLTAEIKELTNKVYPVNENI